jgi:DNA-binding transcriptional LysR family regulator
MNINQLKYFISAVNYLNFTKAAKEHYIAPAAISQQIINLEKELDVLLFHRNKRTMRLTHAGAIFYNEAKRIISNLEDAILNVQLNTQLDDSKYQGNLTIGFQQPHQKGLAPSWVRNFCLSFPNVKIALIPDLQDNLQKALYEGSLDLFFRVLDSYDEVADFSWQIVSQTYNNRLCAVVHSTHPLAQETTVARSALVNERFVHFDRHSSPMTFHRLIRDCKRSGFLPNIVAESTSPETLLLLVAAGTGIAVLPRNFETLLDNDNIRFIELNGEDEHSTELVALWRRNNFNPAISMFLSSIDDSKQGCPEHNMVTLETKQ